MQKNFFREKIIQWYRENRRRLPWRETNDPYKIWLSEIILQQTRVAQGIPYYLNFIDRFPDVASLAAASEQEVLRLWQGLGYYSRARNLHRCAKVIAEQLHGTFPSGFQELQKLPGIGPYTAAAIASIVFKEPVAVVDGNVFRVMARVFGIEKDISQPGSKEYFFSRANELIPKEYPDEYNQAVMEFGALQCVPQNPACETCVLRNGCFAYENQMQRELPVKTKKRKSKKRYLYYFVIRQDKKLLLKKRNRKDIWQGLYDFYSVEATTPVTASKIIAESEFLKKLTDRIKVGEPSAAYQHVLTHQTLVARFIPITFKTGRSATKAFLAEDLKFYTAHEIDNLPKPVLMNKHLSDIGFL
jgi:A/G-specific adenine glycosylase